MGSVQALTDASLAHFRVCALCGSLRLCAVYLVHHNEDLRNTQRKDAKNRKERKVPRSKEPLILKNRAGLIATND